MLLTRIRFAHGLAALELLLLFLPLTRLARTRENNNHTLLGDILLFNMRHKQGVFFTDAHPILKEPYLLPATIQPY